MTKTVLLAGAAALAFSGTAFAGAAHPTAVGKATNFHITFPAKHPPGTIYSQRDNDNGIGIVSQKFTDFGGGTYDAQGADDFITNGKAAIKEVIADGVYFNGSGPADSWNVTVYKDNGGIPGNAVGTCNSTHYTDLGFGTPDIKLKNSCSGGTSKIKVKAGHYWISVQAVMAFSPHGEWGWNTNNTVRNDPAAWQNPGGGFGTGCNSWGVLTTCIAAGEGGDFSYAILGKGG